MRTMKVVAEWASPPSVKMRDFNNPRIQSPNGTPIRYDKSFYMEKGFVTGVELPSDAPHAGDVLGREFVDDCRPWHDEQQEFFTKQSMIKVPQEETVAIYDVNKFTHTPYTIGQHIATVGGNEVGTLYATTGARNCTAIAVGIVAESDIEGKDADVHARVFHMHPNANPLRKTIFRIHPNTNPLPQIQELCNLFENLKRQRDKVTGEVAFVGADPDDSDAFDFSEKIGKITKEERPDLEKATANRTNGMYGKAEALFHNAGFTTLFDCTGEDFKNCMTGIGAFVESPNSVKLVRQAFYPDRHPMVYKDRPFMI